MNKFEKYSVVAGIALSAVSAMASAYAAWQTTAQVKYAQQALTAADLNRGFESFYDAWATLCDTIDVTGGYVVFDAKLKQDQGMIVVEATDLGYPFEPIDQAAQRIKVIKAMDKAVAAHDKLAMWMPHDTLESMRFE